MKKIFYFFKSMINAYFVSLGILCTLFMFWIFSLISASSNMIPTLKDSESVILRLNLQGDVLQKKENNTFPASIIKSFTPENHFYLPGLEYTLRKAQTDKRIKALFIEWQGLNVQLSDLSELRSYLLSFKQSKKPIYFWSHSLDNKGYYLASVADKIYFAPQGDIRIPGPLLELVYFGDALKKLGVGIDVIQSGKFKNVFEPFVSNQPSAETLEVMQSMEKNIRHQLIQEIAIGRKKTSTEVEGWFKQSLFTAKEALRFGIVDHLNYLEDVKEALAPTLSSDGKNNLVAGHAGFYKYSHYEELISQSALELREDGVAIIELTGEIHFSSRGINGDDSITPYDTQKELQWAEEDDKIKAIVLRISSPGGSSLASDMIWNQIERLKQKKPVVVSMGASAASGGYYIAAPASQIFASALSITGSIGVIGIFPSFEGLNDKFGVSIHSITASDRVKLLSFGMKMSPADREVLEHIISDTYQQFLSVVAKGRMKETQEIHEIAQGRVWTGTQARDNGLVDEIGGLREAIIAAKTMAKLPSDDSTPLLYYADRSMKDCLLKEKSFKTCLLKKDSQALSLMSWENKNASSMVIDALQTLISKLTLVKDEPLQSVLPVIIAH